MSEDTNTVQCPTCGSRFEVDDDGCDVSGVLLEPIYHGMCPCCRDRKAGAEYARVIDGGVEK